MLLSQNIFALGEVFSTADDWLNTGSKHTNTTMDTGNLRDRAGEIYNMFLGENGVQKLLNGRKLRWTSLQEIDDIIEKQILPHLDLSMTKITDKIKEKYSQAVKRNKEVLK